MARMTAVVALAATILAIVLAGSVSGHDRPGSASPTAAAASSQHATPSAVAEPSPAGADSVPIRFLPPFNGHPPTAGPGVDGSHDVACPGSNPCGP